MILRVINTVGSISKMHRLIIRLFFHNHIVWTAYPSPDRVWGFTGRLKAVADLKSRSDGPPNPFEGISPGGIADHVNDREFPLLTFN